MSLVDHQVQQEEAVPVAQQSLQENPIPVIYRLHRWIFAACIVLGTLSTLGLIFTDPIYYSVKDGVPALVAGYAAASTVAIGFHLFFLLCTVFLLPAGLLAMASLAMRRAPWLASFAMLVVIIGMTTTAVYPAVVALSNDLVRTGNLPLTISILSRFNNDGIMRVYNIVAFHGTVWGPATIGIALWRARVVPTWAAVLLTFGRLSMFVLDPLLADALPPIFLQTVTWTPIIIGSIPAALAILKTPLLESRR
jgi:hypothetical protein